MPALKEQAEAARRLIVALSEHFSEDDAHDVVEGETDFIEAVTSALRRRDELVAMAKSSRELAAEYGERARTLEDRARVIGERVVEALEHSGLKRVETPVGVATAKAATPKLVVVNEAEIPSDFWVWPEPKINRSALMKAAKDREVPGVVLNNGGVSLQVRRA